MIDYTFTYRHDSLDLEHTHDASLYIRVEKNEISFLIADADKILAWKDDCPASELAEGGPTMHILTSPFKKITLGITPDALTLVPTDLFDGEKDAALYARYLDVKKADKVFYAQLDTDNYIVYKTSSDALNELSAKFDLHTSVPADRGWLEAVAGNAPAINELYINIANEQVAIAHFQDSKLHLYNCFDIKDVNDVIYYCMFIAAQLQYTAPDVVLVASGNIVYNDGSFKQLSAFFKEVRVNDTQILQTPSGVPSQHVLAISLMS